MRASLVVVLAAFAGVIVSCGDDSSSNNNRGSGAKQSKVSADAYPAVAKFNSSDVAIDKYGPLCDELATVAHKDTVAAVSEDTCRRVGKLADLATPALADIRTCPNQDCVADKAEPVFRKFLQGLKDLAASYNAGLDDALRPGACLTALRLPDADVKAVDTALDKLPDAIKRLRNGDTRAMSDVFDLKVTGDRDPKPCKP
jgi:hypothetical protein